MYDDLSEADIQKMKEEIEYRKVVVRKEALTAVKEAREQGDLSENFEYQAAKIRYLERMVKTAKVIEDRSKEDEVGLNNTVTVYFEDEDEEEVYRIVTTVREDVLHGLISIDSPVGKALMGHRVGDTVHVQVNDKYGYDVQIRKIDKTTDESDDKIRDF